MSRKPGPVPTPSPKSTPKPKAPKVDKAEAMPAVLAGSAKGKAAKSPQGNSKGAADTLETTRKPITSARKTAPKATPKARTKPKRKGPGPLTRAAAEMKRQAQRLAKKKPSTRTRGRPSVFTPALAQRIADGIASGKNLLDVCDEPGMPDPRTVQRWMTVDADFSSSIARARELWVVAIDRQILDIQNDPEMWEDVELEVRQVEKGSDKGAGTKTTIRKVHKRMSERAKMGIYVRQQIQARYTNQRKEDKADQRAAETNEALNRAASAAAGVDGVERKVVITVVNAPEEDLGDDEDDIADLAVVVEVEADDDGEPL